MDLYCFLLVIETLRIFIYMSTRVIFMYVVDLHHFHLFGEALCLRVAGIGMALECPYSVIPCSSTHVFTCITVCFLHNTCLCGIRFLLVWIVYNSLVPG